MFVTAHTAVTASANAWCGAVSAASKRSRSAVREASVASVRMNAVQAAFPVIRLGDGVHTEDPAP